MTLRSRKILKEFFKEGKRPTQQEFADLIDSAVNISDDGYSKNSEDGLKLAPINDNNSVISVCTRTEADPSWVFSLTNSEDLLIKGINHRHEASDTKANEPSLIIESSSTIIKGDLQTLGIRKGKDVTKKYAPVANGIWHNITPNLYGIYALEVVACVLGKKGDGEYAITVAMATTCFRSHGKIKTIGSYYGYFGHKIKLRWHKNKDQTYNLQVKTRLGYKNAKDSLIHCSLTYLYKHERDVH